MKALRPRLWFLVLVLTSMLFLACTSSKKITVAATATLLEDVARSAYKQTDLRLIREGMPAYLMLMDGMVEAWPDKDRILIAAAQSHASFASTFIQDQDRAYANLLYAKARDYGIRALAQRGLVNPQSGPFEGFEQQLKKMDQPDVPYLFWAATCWGGWISLNQTSMEALAELPRVEALMERVLDLDEGFYFGGPHLFKGILLASRPPIAGGDLERARVHFLKAIEYSGDQFLMTRVYYAEFYARKTLNRELYVKILTEVLQTPADRAPELTLLNTVAHRKAENMLRDVNEFF
jgi:hypothetical protein